MRTRVQGLQRIYFNDRKWTCQKCGHVERGSKQPGQSAREAAATPLPASVTPTSTTPLDDEDNQVDEIMNVVGHVLEVQRELGVHLFSAVAGQDL